jgi:hypothetical protein
MFTMMVPKASLSILMMQLGLNNPYIPSDSSQMEGYRLEASFMVFAMVLLSFHFPEGASAKWRRIPMLQME